MKKVITYSLYLLLVSTQLYAGGDSLRGSEKVAVCAACHGADGNSVADLYPNLAGQNQAYLEKQMKDIKAGERPIPLMVGQLDNMTEFDIEDIAAFYAQSSPSLFSADPALVEVGESIYRAGNSVTGVAACTACHSPTGSGNDPAVFPAIGGQYATYIATQLRAFRSGERTNDGDTRIMRDVAFRMSDAEIDAVASYVSGLH